MSSNHHKFTLEISLAVVIILSSMSILMSEKNIVIQTLSLAAIVISLLNLFLMYRSIRNNSDH